MISHPNIIYDNKVLGGDDFEIGLQVKDLNELRNILNKIYEEFVDIIREHKVIQYYKEHKFLLFPSNIQHSSSAFLLNLRCAPFFAYFFLIKKIKIILNDGK